MYLILRCFPDTQTNTANYIGEKYLNQLETDPLCVYRSCSVRFYRVCVRARVCARASVYCLISCSNLYSYYITNITFGLVCTFITSPKRPSECVCVCVCLYIYIYIYIVVLTAKISMHDLYSTLSVLVITTTTTTL